MPFSSALCRSKSKTSLCRIFSCATCKQCSYLYSCGSK
eukprot:05118.XXX_33335_33448_1 [CDS] Oithona nana genome sequencing.